MLKTTHKIFSNSLRILGNKTWGRILEALGDDIDADNFPEKLDALQSRLGFPAFIPDLARIEWALFQATSDPVAPCQKINSIRVNPTLKLVPVEWKHLPGLMEADHGKASAVEPCAGTHVMAWRHPTTGKLHVQEADNPDLLSLKIIAERIDKQAAAAEGGTTVGVIDNSIQRSMLRGILISPISRIKRIPSPEVDAAHGTEDYVSADTFTLQWHITQVCDLHCRHCYDRSHRSPLPFDTAMTVLDDLYSFCQKMHVRGHVSFTGGNPLLYPHFMDIYKETVDRGFGVAILGNPTSPEEIEKLIETAKPSYFQISLEGLEAHNDHIRGKGHFQRSMVFLDQLRSRGIFTMVMLTLTSDNIDQVLPLAEVLRERTDFFTFNRLSTVGEGARLQMAETDTYQRFLRQYCAAARQNPILGFKDNLINIILHENEEEPFGGCTGYGCGAAFNFLALLADGEVHACRKFPSLIGNILENRLTDIYHSDAAELYRNGSQMCSDCRLNAVCRGCLAITHSYGLDVSKDKDPYCFMQLGASLSGEMAKNDR